MLIPELVLIFSIPWGYFADTYGRKPTIFLILNAFWLRAAWIQLVCYFEHALPLRLVWLSSFHTILGGSSPVLTAVVYTVMSDITSETTR